MWDRKELKEKGKNAYKRNTVPCIVASFILTVTGAAEGASVSSVRTPSMQQTTNDATNNNVNNITDEQAMAIFAALMVVIFIACILATVLSIFLLDPLAVGARKFFIENAETAETTIGSGNIGYSFSPQYKRIVGGMFTTKLFIFLWSLLLIVPGIIKSYSWRLVPYILSEYPDMTGAEAREYSAQLMEGSKMDAFVLDLSFIGWFLLGALTFGILNLFWTTPYKAATDAELYLTLATPNQIPETDTYVTAV